MSQFLKDSNNNWSCKRILGSIMIFVGLSFSVVLFFFSLHKQAIDAQTAKNIIDMLLISGSGLVGISVFERIAK